MAAFDGFLDWYWEGMLIPLGTCRRGAMSGRGTLPVFALDGCHLCAGVRGGLVMLPRAFSFGMFANVPN